MVEFDPTIMKDKGLVNYWSFDDCLIDSIDGKNLVMNKSDDSFTNDRNEKAYSALNMNISDATVPYGVYFNGDFTGIIKFFINSKISIFLDKIYHYN